MRACGVIENVLCDADGDDEGDLQEERPADAAEECASSDLGSMPRRLRGVVSSVK